MDWSIAYLVCMALGLSFVGFSFLFGHLAGHGDAGADGDASGDLSGDSGDVDVGGHDVGVGHDVAGHAHDFGGHGHAGHDMADGVQGASLPLFSPTVLAVFVGMFGIGGLALLKGFGVTSPLLHVPGAAGISLGSGFSIAWLMMQVMRHAETNTTASHAQLVGRTVEVAVAIRGSEFGEIAYEAGGARQTLVARSEGGQTFQQGDAAQVIKVVEGVAWVSSPGSLPTVTVTSVDSGTEGKPVDLKQRVK